jgi:hypothetical protein
MKTLFLTSDSMPKVNAVKSKFSLQTGFKFFVPQLTLLFYWVVGSPNKFRPLLGKTGQNA